MQSLNEGHQLVCGLSDMSLQFQLLYIGSPPFFAVEAKGHIIHGETQNPEPDHYC